MLTAYSISVTLANIAQTFVAKKLGDETAEDMGFSSLNPFDHISLGGAFCFLIAGIGWSQYVPIENHNFTSPLRTLKIVIAQSAGFVAQLMLAITTIIFIQSGTLGRLFSNNPGILKALGQFFAIFYTMCIVLASVEIINRLARAIVVHFTEKGHPFFEQHFYFLISLFPLLCIILFTRLFTAFVTYPIVIICAQSISHALGFIS